MRGRLNLFQSSMVRWRELHPYTAIHVVRVQAPLDRGRVHEAIRAQLSFAGLTGLVLDRVHRRYEYRGGEPEFELTDVERSTADAERALATEIERQLNRPFPAQGRIDPFRFFLLPEAGTFRLGLAYDHFIAGGDSIVALMNDIVDRYQGVTRADASPPLLYPPSFRRLFLHNLRPFVRGLGWLRRAAKSCRRGLRPRYSELADGYNGFTLRTLDAPVITAFTAAAKSWQVTFNDLLLAVILRAISSEIPDRAKARRRRELAVAAIINLRQEFGFNVREVFGQFLSSMRISHAVPPDISLEQLARDIRAETSRIKSGKLYLQTLVAVRANGIVWMFLDAQRRQRIYAKAYPVWAGLTTLNINALWRSNESASSPPDYVRAVPTGPLAPLVIAATTCGTTVHLGVSYRRSAFSREKVDRIADSIAERIRSLQ